MFFPSQTEDGEREFRRLDPKAVMRLSNDTVARRASRLVLSKDDRQLRFVENRLGRQPKIGVGF
jgi:hypothetical protein